MCDSVINTDLPLYLGLYMWFKSLSHLVSAASVD